MKPDSDCQGVLDLISMAGGRFHICSLARRQMISVVGGDVSPDTLREMRGVEKIQNLEVELPRKQGE